MPPHRLGVAYEVAHDSLRVGKTIDPDMNAMATTIHSVVNKDTLQMSARTPTTVNAIISEKSYNVPTTAMISISLSAVF